MRLNMDQEEVADCKERKMIYCMTNNYLLFTIC